MAYDPVRAVSVLFGGITISGANNGETWEWDGTVWTPRGTAGPPPRRSDALVYDAARGVAVLFGGSDGTNSNGETWELAGTTWSRRAGNPSARALHAMSYDATRNVSVLFGGYMN